MKAMIRPERGSSAGHDACRSGSDRDVPAAAAWSAGARTPPCSRGCATVRSRKSR